VTGPEAYEQRDQLLADDQPEAVSVHEQIARLRAMFNRIGGSAS
jgi:hypothetical protein